MQIKSSNEELVLVFNSNTPMGSVTLSNARASGLPVKEIDLSKVKITPTQWLELATAMNLHISELIDQEREGFERLFEETHDYDEMGWIEILEHHPELLTNPIVIHGSFVRMVYSPSEILGMHKDN